MASRRASEYWGAPRKGDDRVWGSGQTPSIQIAIMLLGAAAGFFKVTIPSLGAAGVRDTHILPADLDGREPPGERQPGLFLHTVDRQQDPANPNDRIETYEFMPDWVRLAFTFTLVDTLPPPRRHDCPCAANCRRASRTPSWNSVSGGEWGASRLASPSNSCVTASLCQ
jgi:hypothetical protein